MVEWHTRQTLYHWRFLLFKCKDCGKVDTPRGGACFKCKSIRRKNRYITNGGKEWKKTRYPVGECAICKTKINLWRKDQLFCKHCANKSTGSFENTTNQYKYIKIGFKSYGHEHRILVEKLLGRSLYVFERIHHIDENPTNNNLSNLLILNDSDHKRLHKYLQRKRAILEQSSNGILDNCWNNLRVTCTTEWIERSGSNVIKACELVNQQPSLLKPNGYGEGSEAMRQTPQEIVDEDMVQTTTSKDG